MKPFGVDRRSKGDSAIIAVSGELDLAVADQLGDALDLTEEQRVIVDLKHCEFIDSTGIAVILRAGQVFAEEGRHLAVCCPTAQVRRILSVTGLTGNGLVFADIDDALARVGAGEH